MCLWFSVSWLFTFWPRSYYNKHRPEADIYFDIASGIFKTDVDKEFPFSDQFAFQGLLISCIDTRDKFLSIASTLNSVNNKSTKY